MSKIWNYGWNIRLWDQVLVLSSSFKFSSIAKIWCWPLNVQPCGMLEEPTLTPFRWVHSLGIPPRNSLLGEFFFLLHARLQLYYFLSNLRTHLWMYKGCPIFYLYLTTLIFKIMFNSFNFLVVRLFWSSYIYDKNDGVEASLIHVLKC